MISFFFFFLCFVFFFNVTATTEIYTLSLHDALPIFAERPIFISHAAGVRAGGIPGYVEQSCFQGCFGQLCCSRRLVSNGVEHREEHREYGVHGSIAGDARENGITGHVGQCYELRDAGSVGTLSNNVQNVDVLI